MSKYIRVDMPDGSKWDVPAAVVATNYVDNHFGKTRNYVWRQSFDAVMEQPDTLLDWAESNINWSYVEPHAQKVQDADIDYQDGWVNGQKEVVER